MLKDADLKCQNQYQFKDGIGIVEVSDINENGDLTKVKENLATLKILKIATGFQIENDFGIIKTYTGIKYLDSKKLMVTRRDGKEKEYFKLSE